jgi:hypothetical protein
MVFLFFYFNQFFKTVVYLYLLISSFRFIIMIRKVNHVKIVINTRKKNKTKFIANQIKAQNKYK